MSVIFTLINNYRRSRRNIEKHLLLVSKNLKKLQYKRIKELESKMMEENEVILLISNYQRCQDEYNDCIKYNLDTKEKLEAIPGTPPNMIYPPKGDAFAERNKYALEIDFEMEPPMFKVNDTHYAATWLLHPDAPSVNPPKIVTDRIERMKKGGTN